MRLIGTLFIAALAAAGCSSGSGVDVDYGDAESWFDDAGLVIENASPNADPNSRPGDAGDGGSMPDVGVGVDLGELADTGVGPDPGTDTDGDGLSDRWEMNAGDASRLDPASADSDGDGTPDGDEDYDGDGLDNRTEFAASKWPSASGVDPSPFRRDLLIELDAMEGKTMSDAVFANAATAFMALPDPIGLVVYRDEMSIPAFDFDGSFDQRNAFFASHGPMFGNDPAPLPTADMVHVAVVTRRLDNEFRGAEVVAQGGGGEIEQTGVLVFYDALDALHPQCGVDGDPPDITLDQALAGAFVHELGHVFQLGHDTAVGGGENFFNVMSVPTTCGQAQERFTGYGNSDASLGATEAVGTSRFSAAAAALMRFDQRVSVDTAEIVNDGAGLEM